MGPTAELYLPVCLQGPSELGGCSPPSQRLVLTELEHVLHAT